MNRVEWLLNMVHILSTNMCIHVSSCWFLVSLFTPPPPPPTPPASQPKPASELVLWTCRMSVSVAVTVFLRCVCVCYKVYICARVYSLSFGLTIQWVNTAAAAAITVVVQFSHYMLFWPLFLISSNILEDREPNTANTGHVFNVQGLVLLFICITHTHPQ